MLKRVSGGVEACANLARSTIAAQDKWRHDPDARTDREKKTVIAECDRLERRYWAATYNSSRVIPKICSKTGCLKPAVRLIIVNCHGVMVEVAACAEHKVYHGCS